MMKSLLQILLVYVLLNSFASCKKGSSDGPVGDDTAQLTKITMFNAANDIKSGTESRYLEIIYNSKNVVSEIKRFGQNVINVDSFDSFIPEYNTSGQLTKILFKSRFTPEQARLIHSLEYNISGQLEWYRDLSRQENTKYSYGTDGKVRTSVNDGVVNGTKEYTWKGENISQFKIIRPGFNQGPPETISTNVFEEYENCVNPYRLGGQMLEILELGFPSSKNSHKPVLPNITYTFNESGYLASIIYKSSDVKFSGFKFYYNK